MNKPDINDALKKVTDALSRGRSVQVRGPLGSGRNTLATAIQQQREAAFVELLDVKEIDSTAAAWIQAGSHVPARDRPSLEGGSAEALREYISKIAKALTGSKVLLLYIPPSWTQAGGYKTDNDRMERLAAVLRGFRSVRRRVEFLGTRSQSELMWAEGPDEPTPGSSLVEEVQLSPYAVEIQRDVEEEWGAYSSHVRTLRSELPRNTKLLPIVARLAIGAIALGCAATTIAQICSRFHPTEAIRNLAGTIVKEASKRPDLLKAITVLVYIRRPISSESLVQVTGIDKDHIPLITSSLGYGEPVRVLSLIRSCIQEQIQASGLDDDTDTIHSTLAEHYLKLNGVNSPDDLSSTDQAVAWTEKAHHLAQGGAATEKEWCDLQHPDPALWWDRARALSIAGKYDEAAQVYRRCVEKFQNDDYGWHYLAFNLARSGGPGSEVEKAWKRALELSPGNPWWNARWVTWLIRADRPSRARIEWRKSLFRVDPEAMQIFDSPWLANNLHYLVAREWHRIGMSGDARQTLDVLPRPLPEGEQVTELARSIKEAYAQWKALLSNLGGRAALESAQVETVSLIWQSLEERYMSILPLPVAEREETGVFRLSWSLPGWYATIEVNTDGSWEWYAANRATGESEAVEEALPSPTAIDPKLIPWFDKLCDIEDA
ncbi:MAG: tetratricopeptide repeat protein [Pseudomonadota bacterium]